MAHSCPDCYQTCYCGGDIDDILFEDTKEEAACTHCDGESDYEEDFDEIDDRCPECEAHVSQGDQHDSECPYA